MRSCCCPYFALAGCPVAAPGLPTCSLMEKKAVPGSCLLTIDRAAPDVWALLDGTAQQGAGRYANDSGLPKKITMYSDWMVL